MEHLERLAAARMESGGARIGREFRNISLLVNGVKTSLNAVALADVRAAAR
jgi:hypothetical protein